MNLFSKNKEREQREFNTAIAEIFSNNNIYISDKIVEKLPSVYESINKISSQIAQLPLYLYKENDDFSVEKIKNDYRCFIVNEESSQYETSYKIKYDIVRDLLLYGKSYNYIQRNGNKITGIHHVEYKTVTIKEYIDDNGILIDYDCHFILNNKSIIKNSYDMLIINYSNVGILNSENLLQLMIEYDKTLKFGLQNASMPLGVLKTSGRLTDNAINKLKASWQSLYSGSSNAGKTVVLEDGLDYKSFDIDLSHLQMIDMKKEFTNDVKRLFNLYEINSDEDFLKRTLNPLINAIESSINKYLLLEKEKLNGYYFRTDCSELLRPSTSEQYSIMGNAVKSGILTVNECRQILDLPKFFNESNEGDKLIMSLGSVLIDKDYTATILNLGQTIGGNSNNSDSNVPNNINEDNYNNTSSSNIIGAYNK